MGRIPRITVQQYVDAIVKARGLIAVAARNLGCSRTAVYEAAKRHPKIKQAINGTRETMIDFVEGKLYKAIEDGDVGAIKFYLSTQGKQRGYVREQSLNLSELSVKLSQDISKMSDEDLEKELLERGLITERELT